MTEQQAIKRLKSEMEWESIELNREAFSMGIKALKEIQQYRAIGTVEELQALKEIDNDCTIRHLTGECSYNETGCSGCIGREKIKVALEKSVAKKAIVYGHNDAVGTDVGLCQVCNGRPLRACDNQYCPDCGQHLDLE